MATPNWDLLSKNHIPGRDWASIRNVWSAASIGFDPMQIDDLSDAVEPIIGPDFEKRDNVSVIEFPGRHVAAFHDAAAALLKCAYVLRTVGNCLLGGQPTWASVDAYHFSFLAGRTVLAFLGIHLVHIKDSFCVLDVFPEGATTQEVTKFKKINPSTSEPARLIFRNRSTPIEQRAIWTVLVRAIRVASFSPEIDKDVDKICDLGDGFGRSRNELLYRNSTWLYQEDYQQPTRSVSINDDIHSYSDLAEFFAQQRDANFAFAAIFARVLVVLASDIQKQSGVNLLKTSYAPRLSKFSGFNVPGLDTLFSSVYRKEGYGIDL